MDERNLPLACVLVQDPTGAALPAHPALDIIAVVAPDDGLGVAVELDAEAAILAVGPVRQVDLVMEALAADLHVLLLAGWAMEPEERRRCLTIAQNRGLRLGVLVRDESLSGHSAAFRDWVFGGDEPVFSARRRLA